MKKIDEAYQILKDRGFISYGILIPQNEIESALEINMNAQPNDDDYWMHQGPFLSLKEMIERNGFFATQRGHGKDLFIRQLNEMADYVENIYIRVKKLQKRTSQSMKLADASSLNDEEKNKHYHQLNKLSALQQVTKSVLHKRYSEAY